VSAHVSGTLEIRRSTEIAPSRRFEWRAVSIVCAQLVAFWPVWFDYVRRLRAGIDEPWGLVALATALVLLIFHSSGSARSEESGSSLKLRTRREGRVWVLVAAALVLFFGIAREHLPPLVAAICAVTAVALTLSRLRFDRALDLPLYGLLLLSLPLSSALQFYLGYPMRYLTAELTVPLLRLTGFAVSQSGTVLRFGEQSIWIDAPCSGVKMLWTGIYLAFALAAFYRLGASRTVIAAMLSLVAVVLGNVLRSGSLFYIEAGIVHAPSWGHTAIGLIAFALTAMAIGWCVQRLARRTDGISKNRHPFGKLRAGCDGATATEGSGLEVLSQIPQAATASFGMTYSLVVVLCLVVAIVPLIFPRAQAVEATSTSSFPGWPSNFEGRPLTPEPLTAREQQFLTDFPGKVAKFSDGQRQVIFRWTSVATRRLHLSSDCFRGAGFAITPMVALAGSSWKGASQMPARGRANRLHL